MTTYVSVKDVLDMARRFHRRLASSYAGLADRSARERVQLLLEYLSRHERFFEQALREYQEEGASDLLETRIQYGPNREALTLPSVGDLTDDMGLDEIEREALRVDGSLSSFYREAASRADNERVRQLFEDLAKRQDEDKTDVARNAAAIRREA